MGRGLLKRYPFSVYGEAGGKNELRLVPHWGADMGFEAGAGVGIMGA